MASEITIGHSKRGCETALCNGYEFCKQRSNTKGEVYWRCCKYGPLKCPARIKTMGIRIVQKMSEHNHEGNSARSKARKAVFQMKRRMQDTTSTPAAVQGAVARDLAEDVQMALPDRSVISRSLRRFRAKTMNQEGGDILPPPPSDMTFDIPQRFTHLVLFDSFDEQRDNLNDRIIIMGDDAVLRGLERSDVWLADGTFKKVPSIFFQLYSIHFEQSSGINPAALYCLLPNKTEATYTRLLDYVNRLLPQAQPRVILTDFEIAAMESFRRHYPNARMTGCYFHLSQSVLRKVSEIGMRPVYEADDAIRIGVRCLAALAYVPVDDVQTSFEELANSMPEHPHMDELLSYFEHTYVRGRRLPGRGDHYRQALFPPAI